MQKILEKPTREKIEAQYDRYVTRFREIFEAGQNRGREAMDAAMTSAHENLVALGEISAEQGKQFREYLRRDLGQTSRDVEQLGETAKERLHPSRLGAGALAATAEVLKLVGSKLLSLSDKADESLTYFAGEITSAGTLTCLKCGAQTQLRKTSLIEACPECAGTIYKKGY